MSTRITEPGCYDLSAAAYHADPCEQPSLSASIIRQMLSRSPLHAWHAHPRLNPHWQPSASSPEMDDGTVVHWLVLGAGRAPVVVEADNWRTKAAQDLRAAAAARGRVALLGSRYRELRRVAVAIRRELRATIDVPDGIEQGMPEAVLCWQEDGMWCRCMVDWLPTAIATPPLIDFKTTSRASTTEQFSQTAADNGHDIQAAWYRRGYRAVFGREPGPMVFVVAETKPPYGVSRLALGAEWEELGDQKIEQALETWRTCMNRQDWPGYPRRLTYADAPRYASLRWESQSVRGVQQIRDGSRKREDAARLAMTERARLKMAGTPVA